MFTQSGKKEKIANSWVTLATPQTLRSRNSKWSIHLYFHSEPPPLTCGFQAPLWTTEPEAGRGGGGGGGGGEGQVGGQAISSGGAGSGRSSATGGGAGKAGVIWHSEGGAGKSSSIGGGGGGGGKSDK